ncbi:MAG TPA: response regulator transcription factor [Noviherbaspirillum sp.]|uniref:response regulator transcription factor n=1 Tax=Noviherbaspirillum sp. TaxID=1926288 RepID=UPI002B462104|nr:response regulator transcription factor [Noviherbaspirillum sp.]HJV86015.1 response regulator transcription factor [Noviherbaspirillum sp.]
MIQVLLVDDHLIARSGVRLMLGIADDITIVGEAETARDALLLAERLEFDIAIVDIALPDRSGLDLIKLIKARRPKAAVLMLSMYAEDIYAVRALRAGASGYLTKNSPAPMLVAAVRKAAAGGKHLSPELVERVVDMAGSEDLLPHEQLSDRELEVLRHIAEGATLVRIAEQLHLSPHTVTTYRTRILEKMGMASNVELARYAFENDLLP